jgi:hypothetical protein
MIELKKNCIECRKEMDNIGNHCRGCQIKAIEKKEQEERELEAIQEKRKQEKEEWEKLLNSDSVKKLEDILERHCYPHPKTCST